MVFGIFYEFLNGIKDGREYIRDKKYGHGEFRWASGGVYRGKYVEDLKDGYGEMIWADGSTYRGKWVKGIQDGLGIMVFKNGLRKAGIFESNVLVELVADNSILE